MPHPLCVGTGHFVDCSHHLTAYAASCARSADSRSNRSASSRSVATTSAGVLLAVVWTNTRHPFSPRCLISAGNRAGLLDLDDLDALPLPPLLWK
jgi:hypothetical protein